MLVVQSGRFGAAVLGPVAFMAAAGNSCGATAGTAVSVNLPAGLTTGKGWLAICTNSSSDTLSTPPAGWTLVDGPTPNSTTLEGWLYRKDISSSDSSTTVNATLSGSGRWSIGFVAYTGAGNEETLTAELVDTTADTSLTCPGVTPTAANAMLVTMAVIRATTSSGGTVTTDAAYTERVDASTSFAASANTGVHVAEKLLVGQAGTPQSGAVHTHGGAVSSTDVAWTLVIPPG